jgi:prepilin-type N-terminal cleavage/methylation domain-containing protein
MFQRVHSSHLWDTDPAVQREIGSRHQNSGFTLVELLVVIGIIAVLIGVLLPALNRARAQAQVSVCLSNQRQLAMAFMLYANDNRGLLPPYGTMNGSVFNELPDQYWWQLAQKYVSKANSQLGVSFMRCPSDRDPGRFGTYGVNYGYSQFGGVISYATIGFKDPGFAGGRRLSKIKPTTFLTGDCVHWAGTGDLAIYSPLTWPLNIDPDKDGVKDTNAVIYGGGQTRYNHFDPRHNKAGVCSFADGSARSVPLREFVTNQNKLWGP